jgi:hypothetical protein
MKKIPVNFDEIQHAMEDVVRDKFDYFLDLRTGQVISLSEKTFREAGSIFYEGDEDEFGEDVEYIEFDREPEMPEWMEEELERVLEVLLNEKGRYIRIPERTSAEAYMTMLEFIGFVEDAALKEELSSSLTGKGSFRRFKETLTTAPAERKKWHRHNSKAVKEEIREWLRSYGVDPVS